MGFVNWVDNTEECWKHSGEKIKIIDETFQKVIIENLITHKDDKYIFGKIIDNIISLEK